MDKTIFKHIVGEVKTGEVATMKFFGKVTEASTSQFNDEFDYLENVVKPSLIKILINCEGGSVLYGMSSYATIQKSTIPTECIIEGIAASMGSVLWAAGQKSLMRDYSILMIHNPFLTSAKSTEDTSDIVKAFTKQIETIYRLRFGLTKAQVRSIMDGAVGKDGTYFDSDSAVKAGIISSDNILQTSQQVRDRVKNGILDLEDVSDIQAKMEQISCKLDVAEIEENKQSIPDAANLNQIENTIPVETKIINNKTNMDEEEKTAGFHLGAVAASLGLQETYDVKEVMARISHLSSVEAQLATTQQALNDAQTVVAGKDASLQNLQTILDGVQNELGVFKTKEVEARNANIEAVVQAAIEAGKIDIATKVQWVEMATGNLALVESTLASIPARDQISTVIAENKAEVTAAASVRTTEQELADKVNAVVGEGFKFKTND